MCDAALLFVIRVNMSELVQRGVKNWNRTGKGKEGLLVDDVNEAYGKRLVLDMAFHREAFELRGWKPWY